MLGGEKHKHFHFNNCLEKVLIQLFKNTELRMTLISWTAEDLRDWIYPSVGFILSPNGLFWPTSAIIGITWGRDKAEQFKVVTLPLDRSGSAPCISS